MKFSLKMQYTKIGKGVKIIIVLYLLRYTHILTGASSSSGNGLTAVSTATWVRIPATGELTFWHRQGQMTDTWQHVTSLDHLCGARIPLYNSKKKKRVYIP